MKRTPPSKPHALESTATDSRVGRIRGPYRERGPNRKDHAPLPMDTLDTTDFAPTIRAIQTRMRMHQRAGGFTSYLFIDEDLRVYLMSEMQSSAATWLRERPALLVGVYATRRADGKTRNPDGTPFNTATAEGLADDIGAHLASMGAA